MSPGRVETAPEGFLRAVDKVEAIDAELYFSLLEKRWGMPREFFDDYVVFRPNRKWLAIVRRETLIPVDADWLAIGIPFVYDRMRDPRLTTSAATQFGRLATRNLIDLDRGELASFIHRRPIPVRQEELEKCTGHGYVILSHRGFICGLGHARYEDDTLTVHGLVPRSWPARGVGTPLTRS